MRTTNDIVDQTQRERALDPHRSFIVQAPAGSGKTTLLVARFVALLETVDKPEEIVAITFTKKAAAEMRARVLKKLESEKTCWPLDEIGQRLKIQTIDALCTSLTRQMPVLARFGAQPAVTEDARELYEEAARRTLALLDSHEPTSNDVARLLKHLDNETATVARLLVTMLARRDQWLHRTGEARSREELEAALVAERERLVAHARALHPKASPEWAAEMLTKNGTWRKKVEEAQALSQNENSEPLRAALYALLNLPPARYDDTQWEALGAIVALLPRAAAELQLVFAERGLCDFTAIAQGAVRALGTPDAPTDLLLALDTRIKHLLVDEFQDTSVSQWELLERLTAGWEDRDGRTVFAVGDPMQSIYRFREAEVGLFLRARNAGIGDIRLEPVTLQTNFRSQAGVVDWVNEAFAQILPREEDAFSGAVPYAKAFAQKPVPANEAAGDAVHWHGFFADDKNEDKDGARANEARRVVEIIQKRRLEDRKADIAILVRNRSALAEIVPALKNAGIRFRAIEIDPLGEKQIVQDLLALTRALMHPADRIAWLALLRAPWCGWSLADLSALAEGEDATIWELIRDNEHAQLKRLREALKPALQNRLRGSLRANVESAWLRLGGPACVNEASALEDAQAFLDHLSQYEKAGVLPDLAAFEESLSQLYAAPDAGDGREAGEDVVQIMTIHKAKGLEFDTVIVPGLDRAPRVGDAPLLRWKERPDASLLLAPIHESGEAKDAIYEYLKQLERDVDDNETARLLYVAATRAKSRLHLLGCVKIKDDALKTPAPRSLLAQAWPVAEDALYRQWQERNKTPASAPVVAPAPKPALHRLPALWQLPEPPRAAPRPKTPAVRDSDIEFSWAGETARHVGTVVHHWLQRMAEDALEGWDEKRIATLRPAIARALTLHGVAANEIENAGLRAIDALTRAINDERGRWLLGKQRNARNEYRITALIDGAYMNLVIDRMFEDEHGRTWIVDYKTSSHDGADIEGFLDRERARYAAQLERYARALNVDAKLGLYFPLLAGWRAWE